VPTDAPTGAPTDAATVAPTIDPTPELPVTDLTSALAPTSTVILYQLSPGQLLGSTVGPTIPIYKLVLPAVGTNPNSPHGGTSQNGADCAACHAAHTSQQKNLLAVAQSQAAVCYVCHAAGGGASDVAADFNGVPQNDASTDSYFSHPVSATTDTETTCSDCHNPHLSDSSRPAQSTTGWTAEGAIAAADGVAVVNGAAGSVPIYTPITQGLLTYEYQLCLNCHAGFATLPAPVAAHPSWWALDAGIEFNPANTSYHPVEAAGRNGTAQMAASLAGTSPFKAWTFSVDSTIRCTNCHTDPGSVNQAADGNGSSHGSPNRGLLTAPYKDRDLKATGDAYSAADFALCYLCHAERPFLDPNNDPSAPDTAFPLHGFHLSDATVRDGVGESGAGLMIDTPGDGQGLATCSECHFRSHSTAIAYAPGDVVPTGRADGAAGLVNFAPNVRLTDGVAAWVPPNADGQGSCTLTCHGATHSARTYTVAPATGFTAIPTSGSAGVEGLTVQFTDATRYASTATATWSWSFGDTGSLSNGSTEQNPSHIYMTAGTYNVTLTVTRNGLGGLATTMTRTDYITVSP
jgi:predicted CXXCH cytochrome family protein